MEYYYGVMFLIIALLQEQVEGFIITASCAVVGFFNQEILAVMIEDGYNFFIAAALIDFALILVSISMIGSKLGVIIFSACVISFSLNMLCYSSFTTANDLYSFIKPYYPTINLILFEAILYTCIAHSRLVPWVKKLADKYGFTNLIKQYEQVYEERMK